MNLSAFNDLRDSCETPEKRRERRAFLRKWKIKSTDEMFLQLHGFVSRDVIRGKR